MVFIAGHRPGDSLMGGVAGLRMFTCLATAAKNLINRLLAAAIWILIIDFFIIDT